MAEKIWSNPGKIGFCSSYRFLLYLLKERVENHEMGSPTKQLEISRYRVVAFSSDSCQTNLRRRVQSLSNSKK